jgi:ribosomal protein S18 acetylase RimI-like enzyme
MILEVAENNRAAVALYELAGYNAVGHRPDYYRNRDGRRQSARILARDLCDL